MNKVHMALASGDYDRVRPLWDGGIQAEGLDLDVILLFLVSAGLSVRLQQANPLEMTGAL